MKPEYYMIAFFFSFSFIVGVLAGGVLAGSRKPKRRTLPIAVTKVELELSHWMTGVPRAWVEFSQPYSAEDGQRVKCSVRCQHRDNTVWSGEYGAYDEKTAFHLAITAIEKTIGDHWRRDNLQVGHNETRELLS